MPNTGPNPISEYISYDNFGWSLLTSLQLVTMDYWESIYNSVSRILVMGSWFDGLSLCTLLPQTRGSQDEATLWARHAGGRLRDEQRV